MKKLMILIILGVFIFTGCPDKKEQKSDDNKVNVMRTDVKAAKVFMNNYLRFVMKKNNGALHSFYGSAVKKRITDIPETGNPHPIGYSMNEGEQKEKKAEFTVHIYSGNTGMPYFSDDEYKYTVAMEKGKMRIDDITSGKSLELYEKDKQLYKKEGDKINGKPLLSLKDLPKYAVPKESASPGQKFLTPNKTFGPCAIAPDGKTIVITSFDINSFIGIVNEEESKETMEPSGGGQGGSSQGGGQGQSKGGGQQNAAPSTTVSLTAVDLYFSSKINNVNFSNDGKMIVTEYTSNHRPSRLQVYDSKSGEPVAISTDKQFNPNRFALIDPYFEAPNELVFTVIPIKNATPEEKKYKGDWKLDIKKGEMKPLE
jgi:hypothetical protein